MISPIETDLFGESYPGRLVGTLTDNERTAIEEAKIIKNYISPLVSIIEDIEGEYESPQDDIPNISKSNDSESDTDSVSEINTPLLAPPSIDEEELLSNSKIVPSPVKVVQSPVDTRHTNNIWNNHQLNTINDRMVSNFTTPGLFSNLPRDQVIAEMNQELLDLRKRVAMSNNMKSFLSKLGGNDDIEHEIRFIIDYAKRKFQIDISTDDFTSLKKDEILELYRKSKEASKTDKFALLYRFVFDVSVSQIEKLLNSYIFTVKDLKNVLIYEDISIEIEELFHKFEEKTVGKYIDHSSPIIRILIYFVSQIVKSKL